MRRKKTRISTILFCLGICLFASCHKSSPSWDTQVLAPVVNASLSINNIITSNYIKNNPNDSSVSLVFTDSLYNLNIDTLLTIPDTVLSYIDTNPLPIKYTVNPGTQIVYYQKTTTYPISTVQLTEGILKSGFLNFRVINPLSQPIDYTYKVLNVININNKGDTLGVTNVKILPKDSLIEQFSLANYRVDFTGPTHNGYNDITTRVSVTLDPSGSPITLVPNDTLAFAKVTFSNIIPSYVKGYFGTVVKTFDPQKVSFPVFNKIVSGSLNLQSVNANITITNGFGVDASLTLPELVSYNSHTGISVALQDNALINSTIHINRAVPTNNPSSPVNPFVTTFSLNPSNSNVLSWLDNLPGSVIYKLQVETDPLGNVSGFNDFAYYGYGIQANINVTIPLSLIATNLTLADTLAVNFGGAGSTTQHVKSGTLTIYAANGFPFSAGIELYLLNKNNVVADSLFAPTQTIASGIINNTTGIVTNPQNSVLTIALDAAHTQELFNTKTLILYARFNMGTLPSTYRKIYDYYQLSVKMVGNFDYQIN